MIIPTPVPVEALVEAPLAVDPVERVLLKEQIQALQEREVQEREVQERVLLEEPMRALQQREVQEREVQERALLEPRPVPRPEKDPSPELVPLAPPLERALRDPKDLQAVQ